MRQLRCVQPVRGSATRSHTFPCIRTPSVALKDACHPYQLEPAMHGAAAVQAEGAHRQWTQQSSRVASKSSSASRLLLDDVPPQLQRACVSVTYAILTFPPGCPRGNLSKSFFKAGTAYMHITRLRHCSSDQASPGELSFNARRQSARSRFTFSCNVNVNVNNLLAIKPVMLAQPLWSSTAGSADSETG